MIIFSEKSLLMAVPVFFMAAGVLLAVLQSYRGRKGNPPKKVEVDPDIRVRVTGKIS